MVSNPLFSLDADDTGKRLNGSVSLVEQSIILTIAETLTLVSILVTCYAHTYLAYNYLTKQHDRRIRTISGKRNLKMLTRSVISEILPLLPFVKLQADRILELFDLAFERSLASVLANNLVKEDKMNSRDGNRISNYSLTEFGIRYYSREIRPVYRGILDHLKSVDLDAPEAKGLSRY